MAKHFKEGAKVQSKVKKSVGRKGVVEKVTPNGTRYFYTVKWADGKVEKMVSQRALAEGGKALNSTKKSSKASKSSSKRSRNDSEDDSGSESTEESSDSSSESDDSSSDSEGSQRG